jgi:hypothetical protein
VAQAAAGKRGRLAPGGINEEEEGATSVLPVDKRPPAMSAEALARMLRLIVHGSFQTEAGQSAGAGAGTRVHHCYI